MGLEDLPMPALVAGAMLLPKEQVTARMLKELLTTQVLIALKKDYDLSAISFTGP